MSGKSGRGGARAPSDRHHCTRPRSRVSKRCAAAQVCDRAACASAVLRRSAARASAEQRLRRRRRRRPWSAMETEARHRTPLRPPRARTGACIRAHYSRLRARGGCRTRFGALADALGCCLPFLRLVPGAAPATPAEAAPLEPAFRRAHCWDFDIFALDKDGAPRRSRRPRSAASCPFSAALGSHAWALRACKSAANRCEGCVRAAGDACRRCGGAGASVAPPCRAQRTAGACATFRSGIRAARVPCRRSRAPPLPLRSAGALRGARVRPVRSRPRHGSAHRRSAAAPRTRHFLPAQTRFRRAAAARRVLGGRRRARAQATRAPRRPRSARAARF
jgi:hypothetical protein